MIVEQSKSALYWTNTNEPGRTYTAEFGSIQGSHDWQAALRAVFLKHTNAGGNWSRRRTAVEYFNTIRAFSSAYRISSPRDVTVEMWDNFLASQTPSQRAAHGTRLRTILNDLPGTTSHLRVHIRSTQLIRPSSEEDAKSLKGTAVRRLQRQCVEILEAGCRRVGQTKLLISQRSDGSLERGTELYDYATVLSEVSETGDIAARYPSAPHRRALPNSVQRMLWGKPGHRSVYPLFEALFPTPAEMSAAAVALVTAAGWNLGSIVSLRLSDIVRTDAGEEQDVPVVGVKLTKPRRPNEPEWTEFFAKRGKRSVPYILDLISSLTIGARRLLLESDAGADYLLISLPLTLARNRTPLTPHAFAPWALQEEGTIGNYLRRFRQDRSDIDTASMKLLRSHFVTTEYPSGHSRAVNSQYARNDPANQERLKPAIANGISNALLQVEQVGDRTLAHYVPRDEVGQLERTPACRCVDSDHHPFTGTRCDFDLFDCLLCPNARISEDNLPVVIAIHDELSQRVAVKRQLPRTRAAVLKLLSASIAQGELAAVDALARARTDQTPAHRNLARELIDGNYSLV